DNTPKYANDNEMIREEVIRRIIDVTGEDPIVSTTGKTSRELFELRVARGETHGHDFLTVGSMGHSSSIALGIALQRPDKKVWIIDGDGAMLMHMGSMAVMGAYAPSNIVHIVVNNASHESVGGQPTIADHMDVVKIAEGCGYPHAVSVDNYEALEKALAEAKALDELFFIEVKGAIGSRADLGRPTTTARENKENFMEHLK
ncbi:MAG: phosphonopyruvate decarboxylase, partial [Mogibacterium sp.]|nr:phosphonopyruvate decarboxylase [Mogibacterium sp.]